MSLSRWNRVKTGRFRDWQKLEFRSGFGAKFDDTNPERNPNFFQGKFASGF